jgi:hypothetical protein
MEGDEASEHTYDEISETWSPSTIILEIRFTQAGNSVSITKSNYLKAGYGKNCSLFCESSMYSVGKM